MLSDLVLEVSDVVSLLANYFVELIKFTLEFVDFFFSLRVFHGGGLCYCEEKKDEKNPSKDSGQS